jgi:hypothetical protein
MPPETPPVAPLHDGSPASQVSSVWRLYVGFCTTEEHRGQIKQSRSCL